MRTTDLSQSGFTLFQAVIGLAVMSIMVLGSMSLFSNMLRQTKTIQTAAEFNQLRDEVVGVVHNADLCTARLKGLDTTQASQEFSVTLPGSNRIMGAGNDYSSNWKITKMAIEQVSTVPNTVNPNLRSAIVSLRAQKNGFATNQVYGSEFKDDSFSIYFEIDGASQINNCVSVSENSVAQANCMSMGGIWDGTKTPACSLPAETVQANCTAFGGVFDLAKNPPCQLPNPCAANEIQVTQIDLISVCKTMSQLVASSCGANEVLVTDAGNNPTCVNKNVFAGP